MQPSRAIDRRIRSGVFEAADDGTDRAIRVFEHGYLSQLIARANGNVAAAAARAAGVDRIHLYRLLWNYGLK